MRSRIRTLVRAAPAATAASPRVLLAVSTALLACSAPRRPPPGSASPGTLVGGCGAMRGLVPRYVLPFTPGESYELTQGNCGDASHDGRFRYGFDFRMPMGTPVLAARDGIVHTVRDDRPDGTGRVGDENLVIIWHEGAELSRYIHLQHDGALVGEGHRVSAGDTIALSGDSGLSAFPHLHFDVATSCGPGGCRTTPAAFLNAEPPIPVDRAPVAAGPLP